MAPFDDSQTAHEIQYHFDLHPGRLYNIGAAQCLLQFAHCKQSVVLLDVLLGCIVPSSVGSTVDIRRQSEETNDLSKHSTAKRGGNQVGLCAPAPAPARGVADCQSREWNQSPLNHRCTIQPQEYCPSLANDCTGMGLIFWSHISPQKVPTKLSVCCAMLQNPHQQAPKIGAAACFNCWCLLGR